MNTKEELTPSINLDTSEEDTFKKYKIAFSGPGGSGKTTLAIMLSEKLNLTFLPSSIRKMTSILGFSDLKICPEKRALLQGAALQYHKSNESQHYFSGFVTDRSPIDFCAYYNAILQNKEDFSGLSESYKRLALYRSVDYDFMFYISPFSEKMPEDGFRYSGDMAWIEKYVCEKLPDLVKEHYPNAYFVKKQSIEERLDEIIGVINSSEKGQ